MASFSGRSVPPSSETAATLPGKSTASSFEIAKQASSFLRADTHISQAPREIPAFEPLAGIPLYSTRSTENGSSGPSIYGEIKYGNIIDVEEITIPMKYAEEYPHLPTEKPGKKPIRLVDLKGISRALFGTAKVKYPEQVAFLLAPERVSVIERNNALLRADEERKNRGEKWSF